MFFVFTSEHEFPEQDWPWIWRLEAQLFGLIMEAEESWASLNDEGLRAALTQELDELAEMGAFRFSKEQLEQYFKIEARYIAAFLRAHPQGGVSDTLGKSPKLHGGEFLSDCIRKSPTFRDSLRSDGRAARASGPPDFDAIQ